MLKKFSCVCIVLLSTLFISCEDNTFPPYGVSNNSECPTPSIPKKHCLTVNFGFLENPSQYRVVMTTHEYPDTAPPFAGATEIIPLNEDYTFHTPIPNAQRDPFLLQPTKFSVRVELTAIKVKPASSLYFYLIQVSGSSFIPSGQPHITTIAEPFRN